MKWIVTGGAGFIGSNTAKALLERGDRVVVFDNLSRAGGRPNLEWLRQFGSYDFVLGDVRNAADCLALAKAHPDAEVVLHLAAQVAVTTSVADPRFDFEVNAFGTFNVCEALRVANREAILLYASTNKVYGGMEDVGVVEEAGRYRYADLPQGAPETRQLDFHSPYGCSKGAAEQYVIDYARIYGIRSVAFRQSCIYGYRQFGIEDQGWVAWFILNAVRGNEVTIYGDGKQVRDVLFIDDLVACYQAAVRRIEAVSGFALNIGGGPRNVMSLLELIGFLRDRCGVALRYRHGDWRPGDQKVFVADIARAGRLLHWRPSIGKEEGVTRLYEWIRDNRALFEGVA
ncbi:MAG: GDP-mannose 4,6-dehydratase [Burkholderiales bacterium]|nr:GDP-mannose 4,6-dehydratase [Burkholderiales bacterium]